jgi:hypothetical protein
MVGWRITLAAAMLAAAAARAQPVDEIRALLDRGQPAAAFELAARFPQRLGEPSFDLLYGIAAVNAGRPGEGVLALERVLLLDPGNEDARLALARGYFLLGDNTRARDELEAALSRNPPPAVARVIREHLEALREREALRRPGFSAYVEAGGGYDSNPRAGVDDPFIILPVLGAVTIPEGGVRAGDRAWQLAGGMRASLPVARRSAVFVAAHAERLRYSEQRDFDQDFFAGSSGFMGRWRDITWRAGASRAYQRLGGAPYRQTHGAFADAVVPAGERNALSLALQAGRFEYAGANQVRDSDFAAVVVGWRHALAAPWRPQLDVAANAGRERNENPDRHDLSRDTAGARVAMAVFPFEAWALSLGASYQYSRYLEPDAVLQTRREDHYLSADLVLSWQMLRDLWLRAELTAAKNESNLELYEYRRHGAVLKGRYEFR